VHAAAVDEQPAHIIALILFDKMDLIVELWSQIWRIFITATVDRGVSFEFIPLFAGDLTATAGGAKGGID
jgi:hypothetical protein